ncbi:MAG: glycosyltransferase family 2 protein, partial [Lentisphaerae bacterium]|nr:glycosyltransferase family 2 protein [Lentisphaerota bacterium]
LVQGCRFPSGGGRIAPGAMPWSHRWIGNPLFSKLVRWWFRAPIHDVYCGMRGFTKALYDRLNLRCTGMEFATEMIIKSSLYGVRMAEVPITLHRDGRVAHAPHLKTLRDGWRTLRFFLMYSPRRLFLLPGAVLIGLGLAGYAVAMPHMSIRSVSFDAHTLLVSTLALLLGYQAVLMGLFVKTFAAQEGLSPEDPVVARLAEFVTLDKGLLIGALMFLAGLALLGATVRQWYAAGFGPLNYQYTMRLAIPGAALAALGFQTLLSSFMLGILNMRRR